MHEEIGTSFGRIPSEIIARIFIECLPPQFTDHRPDIKVAPLLLCRICSHWRTFALSLPELWSSLSFGSDYDIDSLGVVRISERWFRRSGGKVLLSLSIAVPMNAERCDSLITRVLVPHANRFRRLELRWQEQSIFTPFFSLEPSNLELLSLIPEEVVFDDNFPYIRGPNLRKVSTSTVMTEEGWFFQDLLPWTQLTHLIITRHVDVNTWVRVLVQCSRLEQGSFKVGGINSDVNPYIHPTQSVTLLNLHSLDLILSCNPGDTIASIYQLQFPSLRNLRFGDASDEPAPLDWDNRTAFYLQLHSVTALSLCFASITVEHVTRMLREARSLVYLKLDSTVHHNELFRNLASPNIVPKLEELAIDLSSRDLPTFTSQCFVDMVNSRRMVGDIATSSFRYISLSLINEPFSYFEDIDKLLELDDEGRKVVRKIPIGGTRRQSSCIIFPRGMSFKWWP